MIAGSIDERMPGLAVRLDGGGDDLAVLVLDNRRLDEPLRAMLDRVRVGRVGVRDLECDVPDAVPVSCDMPTDRGARPYLTAEHEPRTSRLEHILGTIAEALLRTAIGGARHPENGRVVVRGLLGVADQEMDEIDPLTGKGSAVMSCATAPMRSSTLLAGTHRAPVS